MAVAALLAAISPLQITTPTHARNDYFVVPIALLVLFSLAYVAQRARRAAAGATSKAARWTDVYLFGAVLIYAELLFLLTLAVPLPLRGRLWGVELLVASFFAAVLALIPFARAGEIHVAPAKPGWTGRWRALWKRAPPWNRYAATIAALLLALGGVGAAFIRSQPSPPLPDSLAGQTDEAGDVLLRFSGAEFILHLVDEESEAPIPGLVAAAAPLAALPGQGLLLVWDPAGQYPPQLIELAGTQESDAPIRAASLLLPPAAADAPIAPTTVPISGSALQYARRIAVDAFGTAKHVEKLGNVGAISDALQLIAKALQAVGLGPEELGQPVTRTVESAENVVGQIHRNVQDGVTTEAVLLGVGLLVGGPAGALVTSATLGVMVHVTRFALDTQTVESCMEKGQAIAVTQWGPFAFLECQPPRPEDWDWSTVRPEGIDRPSGLDFLRAGNSSLWIHCDYDPARNPTCGVPTGAYTVIARTPGHGPALGSLTVGANETTMQVTINPLPGVDVALSSDAPTGFLRAAVPVQFTVHATFPNGTAAPCEPAFFVVNPPGGTVATIDPKTGVLLMGEGPGVARVVARCGGYASNAILVSPEDDPPTTSVPPTSELPGPRSYTYQVRWTIEAHFHYECGACAGQPHSDDRVTVTYDFPEFTIGTQRAAQAQIGSGPFTYDCTSVDGSTPENKYDESFSGAVRVSLNLFYRAPGLEGYDGAEGIGAGEIIGPRYEYQNACKGAWPDGLVEETALCLQGPAGHPMFGARPEGAPTSRANLISVEGDTIDFTCELPAPPGTSRSFDCTGTLEITRVS